MNILLKTISVWAIVLASAPLLAGEFSFYSTMRAGRPAGADWQLGVGSTSSASDVTSSFFWSNARRYWRDSESQNFEIGFRSSTQTAYLTVWDSTNTARTVTFANTGAALRADANWTLPASAFFASAAARQAPISIQLSNLTLAPGVSVLSGSVPTSVGATNGVLSQPMGENLVINAASNGGNWYLAGSVRFAGAGIAGGATGSALQFMMNATGVDTPEGMTFFLTGAGLVALSLWRRKSAGV